MKFVLRDRQKHLVNNNRSPNEDGSSNARQETGNLSTLINIDLIANSIN